MSPCNELQILEPGAQIQDQIFCVPGVVSQAVVCCVNGEETVMRTPVGQCVKQIRLGLNLVWLRPDSSFCCSSADAPVVTVTSPSVEVMAGEPLNLSCLAEGNPRPRISWSLRRATGQSEGRGPDSQLILPAVSPADAGFYVCEATNLKGTQSAAVELLVHGERKMAPGLG